MVVIYDQKTAAEKAKLFIQKKHTLNRASVLAGIIGLCSFIFITFFAETDLWIGAGCIIIGFAGIITSHFFGEAAEANPDPDAIYYSISQNERILEVKVSDHPYPYCTNQVEMVCAVTENAEGEIKAIPICAARYRESTKYSEPTFHVSKGIIYVPYKSQQEI